MGNQLDRVYKFRKSYECYDGDYLDNSRNSNGNYNEYSK